MKHRRVLKIVGGNIRSLREKRRLSMNAVAKASAIPFVVYRELEAGRYDAYLDELFDISQTLRIHPSELLKTSGK